MPEVNPQETEKTVKAIQDIAIILTGAAEFVCEGRMRKRFSRNIEENLEKLENDFALLKKKFPGKFPETLKPDASLSKMRDLAITLNGDNADIEAKCRSEELGNELILRATELKAVTKDILDALRGKISRYTIVDKFAGYGGRIKSFLLSLSPLVSNIGRIVLAAILVIIFAFVYLSFTMESEDVVLKSIEKGLSYIEKQNDMLARQRQEYNEITEKIKSFDQAEMSREDKIQWLNLSIKEKKSRVDIEQIMLSIEISKQKIAEKNKKVEEVRKKSFFQKLLRR
ncbi:MAG: hypothetical protein JRI30_01705 [Deltaproteobacteria bacterium]|nr:hypothetical protein [Deltaproteobacteria bacterium]